MRLGTLWSAPLEYITRSALPGLVSDPSRFQSKTSEARTGDGKKSIGAELISGVDASIRGLAGMMSRGSSLPNSSADSSKLPK